MELRFWADGWECNKWSKKRARNGKNWDGFAERSGAKITFVATRVLLYPVLSEVMSRMDFVDAKVREKLFGRLAKENNAYKLKENALRLLTKKLN